MILRKKVKDATVSDGDIVLEGNGSGALPNDRVYIDPSSGRTYDADKGDTLAQLPPDVIELPKSTWGEHSVDSPLFYSNWYKTFNGSRRLELEREQMWEHSPFKLCQDPNGQLFWQGQLFSHGHLHRQVTLVYASDHPDTEMKVYILRPQLPVANKHIHADGSICYQLNDWDTNWTALTVLGTTINFLDAFYTGRMTDSYETWRARF